MFVVVVRAVALQRHSAPGGSVSWCGALPEAEVALSPPGRGAAQSPTPPLRCAVQRRQPAGQEPAALRRRIPHAELGGMTPLIVSAPWCASYVYDGPRCACNIVDDAMERLGARVAGAGLVVHGRRLCGSSLVPESATVAELTLSGLSGGKGGCVARAGRAEGRKRSLASPTAPRAISAPVAGRKRAMYVSPAGGHQVWRNVARDGQGGGGQDHDQLWRLP